MDAYFSYLGKRLKYPFIQGWVYFWRNQKAGVILSACSAIATIAIGLYMYSDWADRLAVGLVGALLGFPLYAIGCVIVHFIAMPYKLYREQYCLAEGLAAENASILKNFEEYPSNLRLEILQALLVFKRKQYSKDQAAKIYLDVVVKLRISNLGEPTVVQDYAFKIKNDLIGEVGLSPNQFINPFSGSGSIRVHRKLIISKDDLVPDATAFPVDRGDVVEAWAHASPESDIDQGTLELYSASAKGSLITISACDVAGNRKVASTSNPEVIEYTPKS